METLSETFEDGNSIMAGHQDSNIMNENVKTNDIVSHTANNHNKGTMTRSLNTLQSNEMKLNNGATSLDLEVSDRKIGQVKSRER